MVRSIKFSVSERIGQQDVSTAAVPLGLLKDFADDVAKFLAGSRNELNARKLPVRILDGSLELEAADIGEELSVWNDLQALSEEDSLHRIDPVRATILESWQRRARRQTDRRYGIHPPAGQSKVEVSESTRFRFGGEEPWFRTERYLRGKVRDLGGKAPNLHLELRDSRVVTVEATEAQLRDEDENHVYREVLLRVSVEEHLHTGQFRNARLVEFVHYHPAFDESAFDTFVDRGTAAWKDVDDPVAWVREQRGG